MEIPTEKLFEFRVRGKEIVLIYCTEDDAWKAYYDVQKDILSKVKPIEF